MRRRLAHLIRPAQPMPEAYRANFRQLYLDIAWFGLLNGSAISFISVYAARLGADGFQIGLLTASPAVVVLLLALPAGSWLQTRRLGSAVVWAAVATRAFYLLWAAFPWFFAPADEIWVIILAILLMTVPATVVSVGFNALFADAVPPEWRGHVVGIRNAAFAFTSTITTLLCGWLLDIIPFPLGYQVVFVIGFIGGMVSCYYLSRVKPILIEEKTGNPSGIPAVKPAGSPAVRFAVLHGVRSSGLRAGFPNHARFPSEERESDIAEQPPVSRPGIRFISWRIPLEVFRFDIVKGPYRRIVGLLFGFHLAQYLAIPVIPLFLVNQLSLTDPEIGAGNAVFYSLVFLGSTQLGRMSAKWGHKGVTGVGILLLGLYPGLIALAQDILLYILASIAGGLAWSMAGGALFNYLLEKVPTGERPPYLAWYNLSLNAAILIGSLLGPVLALHIGLAQALLICGSLRLIAGLAILWLG